MADETNPIVNVVGTVADTASNTVDAAHRSALAVALPVIRQVRDLLGVADFGVDLAQVSLNELLDRVQRFVETGERP